MTHFTRLRLTLTQCHLPFVTPWIPWTALYSLETALTDGPNQPRLNLGNWILTRSYRLGLTLISVGLTQIDVNLLWITRVQYNCRTSLHWWELPWNHLDLVRIHDSCGLKNFVSLNTHWLTWTYSDWHDSLDRLQISTPALEIRSALAHWNCRGLTWTICQTRNLDSLEMIWPDRRSWNWLTLTHTKRVEFQADSKQSPNDFTVAPINARKSYWAPVIQRRFTSIWVSPTEIKVSPSLYERVRIQLPKFKRGWVGPSVKVIPSEYNAVPAHSESVQMRASHQHKDIWVITSELQGFDRSS